MAKLLLEELYHNRDCKPISAFGYGQHLDPLPRVVTAQPRAVEGERHNEPRTPLPRGIRPSVLYGCPHLRGCCTPLAHALSCVVCQKDVHNCEPRQTATRLRPPAPASAPP